MMRAYNPRGTSGSGKTTIVRGLMEASNAVPYVTENSKVRQYRGVFNQTPIYFLGSYETKCGGCDTINSVDKVAAMLHDLRKNHDGIVVYEGLMISHMIGTVGKAVARWGDDHVMAFLDTPLDLCLQRIQHRRDARGDVRKFNPANTIKDWQSVQNCKNNAIRQGYRVVEVPHGNAVDYSIQVIHDLSAA